ncbi:MAG: tryptophan-rich sensory protein [Clostridiales bacterium]|nr:tryptophan-rich sensory protein [Clostridiales bacterium]
MEKSFIQKFLVSFLPVIVVAGLGTLFVNLGNDWFNSLVVPTQWIPNFVIPIVWTVIYLIAAFILYIWAGKNNMPKAVKVLFIINGISNVLWCLLFFTLNQTFIGLIAIILNLIAGIYLLLEIKKVNNAYFYWLFIYPIWLSIATCLNLAIWILN